MFWPEKILNVQVYVEVELVSGKIIVIMTVTNTNVKGVTDTIRWKKYTFVSRMHRQPWITSASYLLDGNSLKRNSRTLGFCFLPPPLFFSCKGNDRTFVQSWFVPTFLWWIIALFICHPLIKILLQRGILIYINHFCGKCLTIILLKNQSYIV